MSAGQLMTNVIRSTGLRWSRDSRCCHTDSPTSLAQFGAVFIEKKMKGKKKTLRVKWQCSSLQEASPSALFTRTGKVAAPPPARSQRYPREQQRYVGKDAILLNFLNADFSMAWKNIPSLESLGNSQWQKKKKKAKVPERENIWRLYILNKREY